MVREWPYASYVALTPESIDLALAQLEADESGVTIVSDTSSNADPSSDELARLFSVVETANSGWNYTQAPTELPFHGVKGKSASWIVEKLGELITKLRSALAKLVKTIVGAVSFSIGLTGPVLSVSINFGG
jgi:hypothetical protein